MAIFSNISWTSITQNFWMGCEKVKGNPACANCYADAEAGKRWKLVQWGGLESGGTRRMISPPHWAQLLQANTRAQLSGERELCFAMSWGDFFEDWKGPIISHFRSEDWAGSTLYRGLGRADTVELAAHVPDRGLSGWRKVSGAVDFDNCRPATVGDLREKAFVEYIDRTPWIFYQLLTKRPQNVERFWVPKRSRGGIQAGGGRVCDKFRSNVAVGYSAADQRSFDAGIDYLRNLGGNLCASTFVSLEPLTGPIRLGESLRFLGRVIVGGESEQLGKCRDFDIRSAMEIVKECQAAGVPVHVKQMGDRPIDGKDWAGDGWRRLSGLGRKGGGFDKWPKALKVRENWKPEILNGGLAETTGKS